MTSSYPASYPAAYPASYQTSTSSINTNSDRNHNGTAVPVSEDKQPASFTTGWSIERIVNIVKRPFTRHKYDVKSATTEPSNSDDDDDEETNAKRGKWENKFDFLLSSIGYAVGLGNVWRFPYLCYKNGGGAFLVPYIIMLFAAGLPMFCLELGFGQFVSKGCIGVWDLAPLFRGLGYGMVVISAMLVIYYNMLIAYTIFYFFASFSKTVPWGNCNNEWNTPTCQISISGSNVTFNSTNATRPAQEFWDNYALGRSEGLHDMGPIRWPLCLSLLLAWIIVFLCLCKGVKSSGKVVYFTATFPYVVLFILFIRGVTLPGAGDGIKFYITPRFDKLGNAEVWKDAAVQIFYSLGPAWGGLHTLASYNKFHNNFQRDAITVALINCGTSIFAGFAIFSVIGFMAHDSGIPIEDVADAGPGLAFVAYPEALARMPGSSFWAILFFFMLFTLGLDSMFVTLETVVTAVVDELTDVIPNIYEKKMHITFGSCVFFFLLGLPMTTNGGIYLLDLMDNYSAGFSLILIAMSESLVISYVYGINKFIDDMYVILKFRMNIYWKICWMVVGPLIIFFVFVFFCVGYKPLKIYEYTIPPWAEFLGWGMILAAILPILIYMVYFLRWKARGETFMERLRYSIKPAETWGPALNKHRFEANYPLLPESDPVIGKKPTKPTANGISNVAFNGSDYHDGYWNRNYVVEPSVIGTKVKSYDKNWTREENVPLPYNFETSI